jgi:heme/copper-type cytochrome/quinol oxidase subunit 1
MPDVHWAHMTTNYLNATHGLSSWLLTRDHKRIALLYLVAITVFFFLGGLMAVGIRLELATPQGDFVSADTYNKLFTLHGVIMVFLFLIPSIPAVLGNFFIPDSWCRLRVTCVLFSLVLEMGATKRRQPMGRNRSRMGDPVAASD